MGIVNNLEWRRWDHFKFISKGNTDGSITWMQENSGGGWIKVKNHAMKMYGGMEV
jgi:hypothetical protein